MRLTTCEWKNKENLRGFVAWLEILSQMFVKLNSLIIEVTKKKLKRRWGEWAGRVAWCNESVRVNSILFSCWLLLTSGRSDGIDWIGLVVRTAVVIEFNFIVHVAFYERHCVVYSHRFWEFTVCFQISGFVGCVFEDDICLCVLVVSQSN